MRSAIICSCVILLALAAHAQLARISQGNAALQTPAKPPEYSIVAQTPDSRTWEHITWHTNGPRIFARTNRYNEVAVGLHYPGTKGEWLESTDQIEIQPGGGATAMRGQHHAYFPGDLYDDAVKVTLPGGQTLASRPIGLAYADRERSVLIAELKPGSTGQLLPSGSQVLYSNICTDIRCDLLVSYQLAGVESEVVLREQLPDPHLWGFSNNVVLQWWTEWFDPPMPDKEVRVLANGLTDELLHFGQYKMVNGKAFLFGDETSSRSRIPVMKHWVTISNRVCLVEEVPLPAVAASLKSLRARSAQLRPNRIPGTKPVRTAYNPLLPPQRTITRSAKSLQLARNELKQPGFSLDWSLLSGPLTNYTFTGDSTTLIRGSVALYGTTTVEGGAVIKFSNNVANSASLVIYGPLTWKTAPYRIAALTSINDNSVGDTISGSTGNPLAAGWLPALDLEGNGSSVTWQLNYARFSYFSDGGCTGFDGSNIVVRSCQFVNCGYGIVTAVPIGKPAGNIAVYNALFTGCPYPIWCDQYAIAENVTAVGYANFCGADQFPLGLAVTNSILASSGAIIPGNDPDNPPPAPVFDHTTTNLSSAGLFQQVGGGAFYLVDGSTNRNAGTTVIDSQLLADLRQKTTYPPILVSNTLLTASDVTLYPQAQRDLDAPDRGVHYDSLDFEFNDIYVTNAVTMTLAPGTAIAAFGTTDIGYGLAAAYGATVLCQGTPAQPARFAEYSAVQESAPTNWLPAWYAMLTDDIRQDGSSPAGYFNCRFTDFSSMAQDSGDLGLEFSPADVRDCQSHGGVFVIYGASTVTNCLFERCYTDLSAPYGHIENLRNSLFLGGTVYFYSSVSNSIVGDNLFDRTTIYGDFAWIGYQPGHNAFVTNCDRINPTNAYDIVLTNTDYQIGPLGHFYYPTNGGMLSGLINAGSTNANLLSLYHYTVTTNLISGLEIKETNSIVDLGFHYVAVDGSGNPIDSDSDGLPDYLEDTNGDGTYNTGDLANWNSSDTDGDGVSDYIEYLQGRNPRAGALSDTNNVIQLQVYTPLK
jgi:hypothetical protein